MKSSSARSPLFPNLALAGLLLCAVAGYAWWKVEIHSQPLVCRVCAAETDDKAWFFHDHVLRMWHTEPKASDLTRDYFDRYLAYPHDHQWVGRDLAGNTGRMPPNPMILQPMQLTRMGYQLVAASGLPTPQDRRRYFENIIEMRKPKIYNRVWQTWIKIAIQMPMEPEEQSANSRIWGPRMEGITIPPEVRAGVVLPK